MLPDMADFGRALCPPSDRVSERMFDSHVTRRAPSGRREIRDRYGTAAPKSA
jgi:hypothetical protein